MLFCDYDLLRRTRRPYGRRRHVPLLVFKYASKSIAASPVAANRYAKWHAQARMLCRALPMDVVRAIGGHICEHAAVMLHVQKWMRGAAVRCAWGLPRLCDMVMDGNLVYL